MFAFNTHLEQHFHCLETVENSCFNVKAEGKISRFRTPRCQNVKLYKAWLTSWKMSHSLKYVSSFLSSYWRSRCFCTMTKFFLYQEQHRTGERNRWFRPIASFGLFFTALMELLSRTVISGFFPSLLWSRWNPGTRWTASLSSLTRHPTSWSSWTSCSPELWCLARCERPCTPSLSITSR